MKTILYFHKIQVQLDGVAPEFSSSIAGLSMKQRTMS